VTTNGAGAATINFNLASGLAVGAWLTATATNQATGDSSRFSNAVSAQPVSVAFAAASYNVQSSDALATIDVKRTGNLSVAVSVAYAASNGSAVAGQDYTAVSGTLSFAPGVTDRSFSVPILPNPDRASSFSTVNLAISQPVGGATLGAIASAELIITNDTNPNFATFVVVNTADSGPGSLRAAITAANVDPNPGVDDIVFDIPASTAANINVPVPGFDPVTQTWQITLKTPLPPITHAVAIDGYTQANVAVPYRYPDQVSSAVQELLLGGGPTGGTFSLTTSAPLPVGTTPPIPFTATAEEVQDALVAVLGSGNVAVTESVPGSLLISFEGAYAEEAIPDLIVANELTGGVNPNIDIATLRLGGVPIGTPTLISSVPNLLAATTGNNAEVRVVVSGGQIPTPGATGFVLDASDSSLRGLAIEGFKVGVSVPHPNDVGNLIQGNFIGEHLTYPVDPETGIALLAPNTVALAGLGNTAQGIVLGSTNTTVGGIDPQDENVIDGNGAQGILIEPGSSGNQVLGNQIGVAGPSFTGGYFQAGNGAEGVLIESTGTAANPSGIVYSSSNIIGGAAAGSGNIIAANHSYGVHLVGVGATRNLVEANYIGAAPGGGFKFGNAQPGNLADGVRIDDAPDNQIGGPVSSDGNVISSNQGDGVDITGADGNGNRVESNIIGLSAAGTAALGNNQAGVADTSPGTMIGPGNVISANLLGVRISGAGATGVVVLGNLIGTDSRGAAGLGNAEDGVEISSAPGATIEGNGQGSQVISGNLVGVDIEGAGSTQELIEGNFIGTDRSGTADRGNSNEGVLIEGASGNTVGGTTSAARNVISANQWGIRIDGLGATNNLIEGNNVGTDTSGTLPLGNEINGIIISSSASRNTIGGTSAGQGNTIGYNVAAGVSVVSGTGNSIVSNSIFSNGHLGIDLVAPGDPPDGVTPDEPGIRTGPNDLQNYPLIVAAVPGKKGSVQATLNSLPDTSFLIQFFSSSTPDPSGYGQGQTYLGGQTIITDSEGNALVSLDPAGGVPVGAWLSATATNLITGDTSEFSADLPAQAVTVQFATAALTVNSNVGVVPIVVERVGNSAAAVSVNYASGGGTAIAGTDYEPVSGTLNFPNGPSNSIQSFTVTIVPSQSPIATATTVVLTLSAPSGGATLGAISTEILTIDEIPGPPGPPPSPPSPINLNSPRVTSERLVTNGHAITGITFTFSKPLVASRAENLANYGYFVYTAGPDGSFGTSGFTTMTSATYNPSTQSVTVTPGAPLPFGTFFQITVDVESSTLLHNGLTDLAGNQLAGSNGAAGTPFTVTFAAANRLTYNDGAGNAVTLSLLRGGLIELFRGPSGAALQLQLAGIVPGKSTLTGSVHRGPRGTGRTTIAAIAGASRVRIRLKTPPFYFPRPTSARTEASASPLVEAEPTIAARGAHLLARHFRRHR
jgi:hypothetical protein